MKPPPAFTLQQLQGGLVVLLGVYLAVVAAILCAIDAFRQRDWLALSASVLLASPRLFGGPYLAIAVAATNQGGASGSGSPQPVLLSVARTLIVLGLPLATILYSLLIARPVPRSCLLADWPRSFSERSCSPHRRGIVFNPAKRRADSRHRRPADKRGLCARQSHRLPSGTLEAERSTGILLWLLSMG